MMILGSGLVPEFGAIFMSNRTTMEECLESKLLGLPSSHSHFVHQVRPGMILFLFEYESRKLHGVFEASSHGEMNIVPHAYSSSGKLFPAQVRFMRIWDCHPLAESEFRDAIEENYYDTHRFNFGLSQDQVCRLLRLFNVRKVEVSTSQSLSCGRKRVWKYESENGDMPTERSTFRRKLSSGKVVMYKQGSSSSDYTNKVYGSGSSEVSGFSCSSCGCKSGSNSFDSGSEPIISEEEPKNLEDSSKDVGTDLGDFIPLPSSPESSSPDNSDCEVENVANYQVEFDDKRSSSRIPHLPLMLFSYENLRQENIDVQFVAPSTGGCHLKEGTRNSVEIKGLYSDAQGKRSSVFSRLNFGSKDIGQDKDASTSEDKLAQTVMFQKTIADLQQSNGKRGKVVQDNNGRVRSRIGSSQQKKTTNKAEFTLSDGKDASAVKLLAPEDTGREEGKTRGHESVQVIMDSLLQKHDTWRKFNAKNNPFKQDVDPMMKKSVFSRLSWVSESAEPDYVRISLQRYDKGNNSVRNNTRVYVQEREGSYNMNKTVEQFSEILQRKSHWKMTRQSGVSNQKRGDEEDSEKSTLVGKMLGKEGQTEERDCIGDSESKCKFKQGPWRKLRQPLFVKSSEVKTITSRSSGSVQMPSEESSAEKENSGSCNVPTAGNTADDKIESSIEKEVQPAIYNLQCNVDKGEAACNLVEKGL